MTVFQSGKKLDLARGVRLARAAYESRVKTPPPLIVEAHYERNGNVLERYDAEALRKIADASSPLGCALDTITKETKGATK